MYRFLLTRRWVGGFAVAVVFAVACVLLGQWQLHRYEERHARNALVTANYDLAPAAGALLEDPVTPLATAATWTPLALSGRYAPEGVLLLRNRPLDGSPGYHVLVPFLTSAASGEPRVLLVDRGWVPTGADGGLPDAVPDPPSGDVDVVVRLRPVESPTDRAAPDGQAFRIDPVGDAGDLAVAAGTDVSAVVTGAYGELGAEDPAPSTAPVLLPRPEVDDGPHLGYALQWVVFAAVALVGFAVVVRRTAEDELEAVADDDPDDGPDGGARLGRRSRRPSDEDVEDAEVAARGGP